MPSGTYLLMNGDVEERFQCAPGPGGWRYTSRRSDGVRTDLVVDSRWRQIRVEVVTPTWWLRGGVTGAQVAWVRAAGETLRAAGETGTEHAERASGFMFDSPAFLVAAAHSLGLEEGARTTVRLVLLSGPSLSPLTVAWQWSRGETATYETETEPLPVSRYEVADLATGEVETVHLAGDVVVGAPGVELTELDSPPNLRS
ncbi:hypothetical protein FXF65_34065 [Actinomadura syzygii]|uniref:Glycolipid-binding domain-containing protein n=2 Tax=Actinomadura syzygii TaxID=1427538 RepID=A0A5D0TV03_9ACTN|nr:hypothetical protein FXF65_34065 [Actinomadura syzygii]